MPHVPLPAPNRAEVLATAAERWSRILEAQPNLAPAVDLQRRLLGLVLDLRETIAGQRLPRLSLPPRYVAAKLARGVPVLAGEPIPLPVAHLTRTLAELCQALADGGAGDAATHIRDAIQRGTMDPGSLLGASITRNQAA